MFENVINFFKKIGRKDQIEEKSKDTAKERLHLVLMQDRANVSADFLDMMRQEIIEVIKKYIDVDENDIDVRLTNKTNEDGTMGAPALYANIPIAGIKEEMKKEKNIEKETKEESKDDKIENSSEDKTADTENDANKNKKKEKANNKNKEQNKLEDKAEKESENTETGKEEQNGEVEQKDEVQETETNDEEETSEEKTKNSDEE